MSGCSQENLIGPYHDGELRAAACRKVEAHVASCEACAGHLAELRRVSSAVNRIPQEEMTPLEQTRLANVFDALPMRLAEQAIIRMSLTAAAVAAVLLVVTSLWLTSVKKADAQAQAPPELAIVLPQQADQARSNLSHWMVRNLGGELP